MEQNVAYFVSEWYLPGKQLPDAVGSVLLMTERSECSEPYGGRPHQPSGFPGSQGGSQAVQARSLRTFPQVRLPSPDVQKAVRHQCPEKASRPATH